MQYVAYFIFAAVWAAPAFMYGRSYERRKFNKWAKLELNWALHNVLKKMYEDGIVPDGSIRIEEMGDGDVS